VTCHELQGTNTFLKTVKVVVWIFLFCSRKRLLPYHSYEGGTKFIARCMDG
jgi:hypothetical protein